MASVIHCTVIEVDDAVLARAQVLCDRVRKKSNLMHVFYSVGDPPCNDCLDKATKELKKKDKKNARRPR